MFLKSQCFLVAIANGHYLLVLAVKQTAICMAEIQFLLQQFGIQTLRPFKIEYEIPLTAQC